MLKKRMTNRQLARWAQTFGQVGWFTATDSLGTVHNAYHYPLGNDNDPAPKDVHIRPWGSEKWEDPYLEVPDTKGVQ